MQFCTVAKRNIDDENVFSREENRRFVLKEIPRLAAGAQSCALCIRCDQLRLRSPQKAFFYSSFDLP